MARYESINIPLKIDITGGDIITPTAVRYTFRSNFEDKQIKIWAYNSETILAEKVETILRRSVLNNRPRDFYDVYILMKTQRQAINKNIFKMVLKATSENRGSLSMLEETESIFRTIKADTTMRERWERYCRENYYAKSIDFNEVIRVLVDIVN